MALRLIRVDNDPILRKKAKPVNEINEKILTLLDDMKETLQERNGVGIAAPQVGVLKRVVVIDCEEYFYEMINPEIIKLEGTQICDEACLSVPGYHGDIERPMNITVQAQNREGDIITVEAEEYLASVLCHELDHLDGVLYLDTATNIRVLEKEEE